MLFGLFSVTGFFEFHRFNDFMSFYIMFFSFLLKNGSSSDFFISSSILESWAVYWMGTEISETVRSVSLVSFRWTLVLERVVFLIYSRWESRVASEPWVTLWWMMLNFFWGFRWSVVDGWFWVVGWCCWMGSLLMGSWLAIIGGGVNWEE